MTTNREARHFAHEPDADPTTDLLEGGLPYVVRHPAANGQCDRPAIMWVYGLAFCELHGEELVAEGGPTAAKTTGPRSGLPRRPGERQRAHPPLGTR